MVLGAVALATAFALAAASETFRYRFDSEKELAEFEVVEGSWKVSAGDLWCTSKGAREELAWRRSLTTEGSVSFKLKSAGRVGIALRSATGETFVRIDRGDARVVVERDRVVVLERAFEVAAAQPIAMFVSWSLLQLEIRIGDDEPLKVPQPPGTARFEKLALVSMKSQPRIDELVIGREELAGGTTAAAEGGAPEVTEDVKLAVERASELAEAGDTEGAFELLVKSLPAMAAAPAPATADGKKNENEGATLLQLPEPALVLLEKLGTKKSSLRARSPLKELVAAATLAARDGSAALVIPLRAGWTATASEIRRTDGEVFKLACAAPELAIEVFRYDQKLTYWFGRDPKIVYSPGGGGATLGRARADDEMDKHAGAELTRPFDKSRAPISGEVTYEYEIVWPHLEDPTRSRMLRELFVLHRGDTWRFSIEGPPIDAQLAAADLEWILATFRFTKE